MTTDRGQVTLFDWADRPLTYERPLYSSSGFPTPRMQEDPPPPAPSLILPKKAPPSPPPRRLLSQGEARPGLAQQVCLGVRPW